MIHSAKGEPLHKRVTVKIIPPNDSKPYKWYWRAPAGQFYSPANIDEILEKVVEHLENKFPQWEFKLVELGPTSYNFVYAGERQIEATPDMGKKTSRIR
jgi:hypothetical protein